MYLTSSLTGLSFSNLILNTKLLSYHLFGPSRGSSFPPQEALVRLPLRWRVKSFLGQVLLVLFWRGECYLVWFMPSIRVLGVNSEKLLEFIYLVYIGVQCGKSCASLVLCSVSIQFKMIYFGYNDCFFYLNKNLRKNNGIIGIKFKLLFKW